MLEKMPILLYMIGTEGPGFLPSGLLPKLRLLRRFAPRNDERLDLIVIARPALQAVAISRTHRVVRQ